MPLSRRVRGLGGAAVVWTAVFGTAGFIVISLDQVLHGSSLGKALSFALRVTPQWLIGGAVMGTLFGLMVMLAERRRDFAALTSRRFALWGLVAGAATSLIFNVAGWLASAHPSSVTPTEWVRDGFQWVVVWGVIGATVAVAHFGLAHHLAKPIDESQVSHRAPVI